MKLIIFAIFLIAMLLVFWLLSNTMRKLAFPLGKRYIHFRFIWVLFVLGLAMFNYYTCANILKLLDIIINIPIVSTILHYVLPNRAFELLYMLLIILGLNMMFALAAITVVSIVKLIFRDRERYFLDEDEYYGLNLLFFIPHKIVTRFFQKDEYGFLSLTGTGHSIGVWAKGMKYVFSAMMAVEIATVAVCICWGKEDFNNLLLILTKAWYWIPFFGYILTQQLELFFAHYIDNETDTFGTTKISETISDYVDEFIAMYERRFKKSDVLVCSEKIGRIIKNSGGCSYNEIENQQKVDCREPEVLEVITKQLKDGGVIQNTNYQNVLVSLLNGASVNIRDNFEGEILLYLATYLNHMVSQSKTVLVLCGKREHAAKIRDILVDGMRKINGIGPIWKICTIDEAQKDLPMSILVCSFSDLIELNILEKRRSYSNALSCVVIASGTELFSCDNIFIRELFNKVSANKNPLQYILLTDVDNDSIRSSMETCIGHDLIPYNNDFSPDNVGIMVWKEESYYKLQKQLGIGTNRSPYMGTGLPLALMAAKYDFPRINIIPPEMRATQSFKEALTMSSQEVAVYLDNHVNLNSVLRYDPIEAFENSDVKMMIAFDTDYNFANTVWRFIKYGGKKGTILHIVSPDYILREYFADQIKSERFLLKNNEFDALFPYNLSLKKSLFTTLLIDLHDKGITESELMKKNMEYGWNYSSVEKLLEDCLTTVLRRGKIYNIFEYCHFEQYHYLPDDSDKFVDETMITLIHDEKMYKHITSQNKRAVLCVNNNRYEIPVLKGDVSNYYLRDQTIVYNGQMYRITAIRDGVIYATQQNDFYTYTYFPISEFKFENFEVIDPCVDSDVIDFNMACADVTREVQAYWKSNKGNCVADKGAFIINDFGKNDVVVDKKKVNLLEINIPKESLGKDSKKTVLTLTYILNELFKTLFPYAHQSLYAVTVYDDSDIDIEQIVKKGTKNSMGSIIRSMIPFTKSAPTHKADCEVIYVVEFSCIEYGMVQLLYNHHDNIFKMIREYLKWYLKSQPVDGDVLLPSPQMPDDGITGPVIDDVGTADDPLIDDVTTADDPLIDDVSTADDPLIDDVATADDPLIDDVSTADDPLIDDVATADDPLIDDVATADDPLIDDVATADDPLIDDIATADDPLIDDIATSDAPATDDTDTTATEQSTDQVEIPVKKAVYMNFGGDTPTDAFALEDLHSYLVNVTGESIDSEKIIGEEFIDSTLNICSFCGKEVLMHHPFSDGRIMCNTCHENQATQKDEIKEIFYQIRQYMEDGYRIDLSKRIKIHFRCKNADEIRSAIGSTSNDPWSGRVLGFYNFRSHALWLESGGPKVSMRSTLSHELTHAWQYEYLPIARIRKAFPRRKRNLLLTLLLEGHASYVELDTMRSLNEVVLADQMEKELLASESVYGIGYRKIKDYFDQKKLEGSHMNAFSIMKILVQQIIDKEVDFDAM